MTDGQNDPRGRRASDWIKDPLDATQRAIQRAINAWRYDTSDDEQGKPTPPVDGVREHLRSTGEFYPEGSVWTPGSTRPADVPDVPGPSPARNGGTEPPKYDGGGRGRHGRARRRRGWWMRS